MRRREVVLDRDTSKVLKNAMKGVDVFVSLFDIPVGHTRGGPLNLRDFMHVDTALHVYNIFFRAWGMFPHHDQVPLYFVKKLYCDFEFHMHLDYMSMCHCHFMDLVGNTVMSILGLIQIPLL